MLVKHNKTTFIAQAKRTCNIHVGNKIVMALQELKSLKHM